ncbi:hypothetical protein BFL28_12440 [Sphingomonas turrisvirgatae]|uniref:Uncharacterized protein n=1 Tax=Sphingomonas turrisvirgatae TaxID=1888892 RepID=A0A1E3M1R7_9SPHN|nr:hypothetical protein BFL28_12440 [Sphingomonas turrisvirgatae]
MGCSILEIDGELRIQAGNARRGGAEPRGACHIISGDGQALSRLLPATAGNREITEMAGMWATLALPRLALAPTIPTPILSAPSALLVKELLPIRTGSRRENTPVTDRPTQLATTMEETQNAHRSPRAS